ncbi:MAG: DUF1579 family protein [bacterium]
MTQYSTASQITDNATAPSRVLQIQSQPDEPAPELKRLEMFIGKWKAEGTSMPEFGRMITEDSYEWFPGGFFLINNGHLQIDDGAPAKHMWIFGYDEASNAYSIHAFDSGGNFRVYQASVHDCTWTFTGAWERATIVFGDDGNTFRARWDISKDGASWDPLCDVVAKRIT